MLPTGSSAWSTWKGRSESGPRLLSRAHADDRLTHHYSSATLTSALAQLPADVREYSDCYDVIEKQLFAQLGNSSGGGSGGGSSSGGSVIPTWLLIVIILLALAALTFGALAIRSRRSQQAGGGPEGQAGSGGPGAGSESGSDDPGPPGASEPGHPPGASGPGDPGSPGG